MNSVYMYKSQTIILRRKKKQVAAEVHHDVIGIHLNLHKTVAYTVVETHKWNKTIQAQTARHHTKFRTELLLVW